MDVYMVVEKHLAKFVYPLPFMTFEAALSEAIAIASQYRDCDGLVYSFNQFPASEDIAGGGLLWLVYHSTDHIITIVKQTVKDSQQVVPVDDPEEDSLPAGWDLSGNPIKMKQFFGDPDNVKPIGFLTEAQKWALVEARIAKRPNFSVKVPNVGTFVQFSTLDELKRRTCIGHYIRNMECDYLDDLQLEETSAL